jgi:flagellar hook assembly protein FlgD
MLVVGSEPGIRQVIAYPNPFAEETHFVYKNDQTIDVGRIDVYTTSGKKVARMEIPLGARGPGQNAVKWDGRTFSGDAVANGVYLFVVTVEQGGQTRTHQGKLVRTR